MDNLDYGLIGNCRSAALINKSGSIDWCCLPEFNSSSVFAKILDEEKGGSFEIVVDDSYRIVQTYISKTNILRTFFTNGKDAFEVLDFMPRYKDEDRSYYYPPDLIRIFKLIKGQPEFSVKYNPKLNYAKSSIKTKIHSTYIKSYASGGNYTSVYLYTDVDMEKVVNQEKICLDKDKFFLMSYHQKLLNQDLERIYLKYHRTVVYWLDWTERTHRYSKYQSEIVRSALVLKLLSYDKTGAILAAATTSIPETIGEVRNWDYRFCWLRDASMVIKVMTNLGHFNMARRFLKFIIDVVPYKDEKVQIMYGIDKQKTLTEKTLDHLSGYKNSKPVRIGNAAYIQKQNDIYGILMDVIYQQFERYENSLQNKEDLWTIVRSVVKIVKKNWQKPDMGIWEFRSEPRHFTFSKLLCWVAIDRAAKIAKLLGKDEYSSEWVVLQEKIHRDIYTNAWNKEKEAFTQYYGAAYLDASTLLMESYGFIDAKDPKFISTVHATKAELSRDGLMYRYKNEDDFGLPSSSFTICTFWLINSLNKIGERQEAERMFEKVLTYANHLGLYSEDIDFETKRLLGNFPQAYSHLALIETAINLSNGMT